jgi:N-acetylmuramoyl-L-alanine amidase
LRFYHVKQFIGKTMNCAIKIRNVIFRANFFSAGIRAGALIFFILGPVCGQAAKIKSYADAASKTAISVNQMSEKYGFRAVTIRGKQITMLTKFNSLLLEGDSRKAAFNNVSVWLNGPITRRWGNWHILQVDIDRIILPLLNPNTALASEDAQIVTLDPGHGGEDQGAHSRSGIIEKKMTLELARKVRAILLQYRVDARLTRNSDQTLELEDRTNRAKSWKSSVFVSIHLNAAENSDSSGIETYVLPPPGCASTDKSSLGVYDQVNYQANQHDRANTVLSYYLQRSLLKHTAAEDRGVRRARYAVLRNSNCPAALVECGYLSNRADENKFLKPDYLDNLARGIAEGILSYLNGVKRANQAKP